MLNGSVSKSTPQDENCKISEENGRRNLFAGHVNAVVISQLPLLLLIFQISIDTFDIYALATYRTHLKFYKAFGNFFFTVSI